MPLSMMVIPATFSFHCRVELAREKSIIITIMTLVTPLIYNTNVLIAGEAFQAVKTSLRYLNVPASRSLIPIQRVFLSEVSPFELSTSCPRDRPPTRTILDQIR